MTDAKGHGPPKKEQAPSSGGAGPSESNATNDTPEMMIRQFLRLIVEPASVFEIRAPQCAERVGSSYTSTVSGYYQYEQIDKAARDIAALDASGRAPTIYVTLNPVSPALLARAVNRLKSKARETTSDDQIPRRRWLLIDCDPNKPSGVSSTGAELILAAEKAKRIREFLDSVGWPEPVSGLSGNGAHHLYAIDLPAVDGGLIERALKALAAKFDDDNVKVDTSVHNPARVTKVFGTMAAGKGDNLVGVEGIEDRPHRRAVLTNIPDEVKVVSRELLEALAAEAPSHPPPGQTAISKSCSATKGSTFDRFEHTTEGVKEYLERHGVPVKDVRKEDSGASILCLEKCPVVPDCQSTGNSDIAVLIGSDGAIAYKNQHNRGNGLKWGDVREALEPGYQEWVRTARERQAQHDGIATSIPIDMNAPWAQPTPLYARACPFPLTDAFPPGTEHVRDYVAAIGDAYQVPVDLPATLIPATAGLAMSRTAVVHLGPEWWQPPNHYFASLMEPGNRKTGPFNEVNRPLLAWEQEEAERLAPMIAEQKARIDMLRRRCERLKDLATGKATPRRGGGEPTGREAEQEAIQLEKQLATEKPLEAPQLITSDATPEELARLMAVNGERMGVFSDESEAIEIMLGRYDDKPNVQLYNKGYDGSMHRSNRVSRARVVLKHPLISIGLVVQPEAVRDFLLNRMAKGTGLTSRFAWCMPTSLLGAREIVTPAIPQDLRGHWDRGVRALLACQPDPKRGVVEVPLSSDALAVFHDFCAHIEPSLSWCGEFAAFGMQDWGGKLCGRIGRIALVLHGLRYGLGAQRSLADPISKSTMVAAIAWAPYLIEHAKVAMGWLGIDDTAVAARRVLAWIARTSVHRFSKQECFTGVRNSELKAATDIDGPLGLLCDLGYLRGVPRPVEAKRGRPASPEFVVNPKWDRGAV